MNAALPLNATLQPSANAPPDAAALAALLDEPPRKPWYRRPATAVSVLALAAAVWAVASWQSSRATAAAPVFVTQPATRGGLTVNVVANGTLQPTRTISIGSELSGTVTRVLVDVNDRVKKGQVLVELDTAKLQDQVARSRATLAAAQAKVQQVQATVKESEAALQRLEAVAKLSGGQVPAVSELDAARATRDRASADLASARASVTDAQAALSTDSTNLGKASIRAPADGVVLTRAVDPGNAVAASLQAVTLFTIAEDLRQLRLQVNVDEADVGAVKAGQTASFTVAAYPSRSFPARITRVAYGSTTTDNVVTYLTVLDVDNADLSLRPGMTATATIAAVQRADVLRVPNSALRYTPAEAPVAAAGGDGGGGGVISKLMPRPPGGAPQRPAGAGKEAKSTDPAAQAARRVWVLNDGRPEAVAVTTGISDGRQTEITGGALQAGMAVITDQKAAGAAPASASRPAP